jgi:hypothetical protein
MKQRRYPDKRHSHPRRNNGGGGNGGGGGGSNGQRQDRAKMMHFKYMDKARDALSSGDRITAEYYFQYADHYSRLMYGNPNESGEF